MHLSESRVGKSKIRCNHFSFSKCVSSSIADITARIESFGTTPNSGLAELIVDGQPMYILSGMADEDRVASVFCRSVDSKRYMFGHSVSGMNAQGTVPRDSVLLSGLVCEGDESSVLDCKAATQPRIITSDIRKYRLLHVECNDGGENLRASVSVVAEDFNHLRSRKGL